MIHRCFVIAAVVAGCWSLSTAQAAEGAGNYILVSRKGEIEGRN